MKSNYFKVGTLVEIVTPKSHLPDRNVTILEVHQQGLVGRQEAIKDSPVKFYSWNKIENLEVVRSTAVTGVKQTSGGAK